MLKEPIVVGKAYVNEHTRILREVTEELDEECIKFNAFDLNSGRLLPSRHRTIAKRDMASWAEREARPDETARAHPFQPVEWPQPEQPTNAGRGQREAAKAALQAIANPHAFPPIK